VQVDHFVPWARHPDDAIENLVVADGRCNGDMRAFLAAPDHVGRWLGRHRQHASALALRQLARPPRDLSGPGTHASQPRAIA